jgi:hypothetical protein
MTDKTIVKAGRLLSMDSGEYSDYGLNGFYVALRDFNPFEELELYFDANPAQRGSYSFEKDQFIASVIAKGYLLEIEPDNLYLGSYSSAEFRLTGPA